MQTLQELDFALSKIEEMKEQLYSRAEVSIPGNRSFFYKITEK